MSPPLRRLLISPLLSALMLGWFGGTGCVSARKEPSTRKQLDLPLLAQAWGIIQSRYVEPAEVNPTDATYGALSGMVDALGDTGHSTFLTPDMVKRLKEAERGQLKGIGIEIQMKNGAVVVVAPLDNSPAQKAGLRPGDVILRVDGEDISGWSIGKIAEQITGPAGTWVHLTILGPHNGRTREVAVVRATIKLHPVSWGILPGTRIVHLRIATFDVGATREIRTALGQVQREGAAGVILDLRDNPGGFLDEAVGVASQFLQGGNVLLAKDARGHITPMPAKHGGLAPDIPLVALLNNGTGSAAEIVAGALKDGHRAPLLGQTTFGTGTVLQQFALSDGSALLLAIEEWLTPNGDSFWHKGIAPQVEVALPAEATPLFPEMERGMSAEQLQSCGDRQLLRALELLQEGTYRVWARFRPWQPRLAPDVAANQRSRPINAFPSAGRR
jgi:carboxyl-terminal processing protease